MVFQDRGRRPHQPHGAVSPGRADGEAGLPQVGVFQLLLQMLQRARLAAGGRGLGPQVDRPVAQGVGEPQVRLPGQAGGDALAGEDALGGQLARHAAMEKRGLLDRAGEAFDIEPHQHGVEFFDGVARGGVQDVKQYRFPRRLHRDVTERSR